MCSIYFVHINLPYLHSISSQLDPISHAHKNAVVPNIYIASKCEELVKNK